MKRKSWVRNAYAWSERMSGRVDLLVAADEFQCLDEQIDTAPFSAWFRTGRITVLDQVRRTNMRGLLEAATALRNGMGVSDGLGFRVRYEYRNQMPFAIGHAINAARTNGGDVAVIVAPGSKPWADELIGRLSVGLSSARQTVPTVRIGWESRAEDEVARARALFDEPDEISATDALQRLEGIVDAPRWVRLCLDAIAYQRRVCGQEVWPRLALEELLSRKAALHRAYGRQQTRGRPGTDYPECKEPAVSSRDRPVGARRPRERRAKAPPPLQRHYAGGGELPGVRSPRSPLLAQPPFTPSARAP